MSKDAKSSGWLVQQLEDAKDIFDEDAYPLMTEQEDKFGRMLGLLKEDDLSRGGSVQRRQRRIRARRLLVDVGLHLGAEVLFLCTQATSISQLATVNPKGLLPDLHRWWASSSHPKGLTAVANQLWSELSVQSHISPSRKRTWDKSCGECKYSSRCIG
jgi:hypothetical protein